MNSSTAFPCIHRGPEPLETRLCDLCGIKGQPFEVYPCQLFGECSLQRKHSQVRGCAACEARIPGETENMPAALPEGIQRINANLQQAVASGRFLVTVAWIEDGQIRLERETSVAFPRADFPKLAEMLVDGLMRDAPDHFKSPTHKSARLEKTAARISPSKGRKA